MRMTIEIDEHLLAKAAALSGIGDHSALLRVALKALIARESARHLAQLGGSEPHLGVYLRRQGD